MKSVFSLHRGLVLTSVAIVLVLGAFAAAEQQAAVTDQLPTGVTVPEPRFDWGSVDQGAQVSHEYRIVNASSEPLKIEKVKPG